MPSAINEPDEAGQPSAQDAASRSMKRVLIIGCGGAGKSTFAVSLGAALGIPVYHLDRLFWQPGWVPSEPADFEQKLHTVLDQDTWIMDGNYGGTLELRVGYADTIVFLDMPTVTCLWGAIRRLLQYRGQSRPDMTEGNAERINLEFLMWILSYRRTRRPGILAMLKRLEDSKNILILRSRNEVANWLYRLQRQLPRA